MTERLLFGLLMVLTLAHTALMVIVGDWMAAALVVLAGFGWLALEARQNSVLTGLFFAFFVALTALGILRELPLLLMLVLLLGTIAAWDLARFRSRMTAIDDEIPPALEQDHQRKLGVTLALGGGLTLLPLAANIPVNFLVVAIMTLLLLFVLRLAIRQLRRTESS
jgi:hypothetical protein